MLNMVLLKQLKAEYEKAENKLVFVNELRQWISQNLSSNNNQPVDNVQWVHIEQVQANDYNPNIVARVEMKLLYTSIFHDGYTQPIVTIHNNEINKNIIVDGFHRYLIMKHYKDIYEKTNGMLPVVTINKDINERMASTVRHNRARGKHSISGMSNMVFNMLDNGWKDQDICNELGMEPEELLRLKHITGFSKLFKNVEYNKAWEHKRQILLRKKYEEENKTKHSEN